MTTIASVDNNHFWSRHYAMEGADPIEVLRKRKNDSGNRRHDRRGEDRRSLSINADCFQEGVA